MFLYGGARGAMFPLVALVAVQVKAEGECPSLLMLTTRSGEYRIPFQDNECKGPGLDIFQEDKVRDNKLTFDNKYSPCSGCAQFYGIYLRELSFEGTWYTITAGQPVQLKCLTTDSLTIHFKVGRKGSSGVANVFMNGNSDNTVTSTTGQKDHPQELNFAFEGTVEFGFFDGSRGFFLWNTRTIRLAQGHRGGRNNWWIGHDECTSDVEGLLCGPLYFSAHRADAFYVNYLKRAFHEGTCTRVYMGVGHAAMDRAVLFRSLDDSYSIQSFSFQPSWYAVTQGESVPTDCLHSNHFSNSDLVFTAGSPMSFAVQTAFAEHQTGETVLTEGCGGACLPAKLAGTFEGNATFTFKRSGEVFSSSKGIRLGHDYRTRWWLGNTFCRQERACNKCSEALKGQLGLVCGDLFFLFKSQDEVYVAPLAWIK